MFDSALMERATAGDRTAQGELARQVYPRVLAFCRSQVQQLADAEELAQETLLRAMTRLATLHQADQFFSWLRGIAANVCRDWHRRHRPTVPLMDEVVMPDIQLPLESISESDERLLLRQSIAELPTKLQEVVFLFYYEEMTYDQMAAWLGVARATINERLSKAREILRLRLGPLRSSTL